MERDEQAGTPRPRMPGKAPGAWPAAMVGVGAHAILLEEGKRRIVSPDEALLRLAAEPHLVCHATTLAQRLALACRKPELAMSALAIRHYDVAELFAFALPADPAPPLPTAMLARLIDPAQGPELTDDAPEILPLLADALIAHVASRRLHRPDQALKLADYLKGSRWPWADAVLAALEAGHGLRPKGFHLTGLEIWEDLPEWEEPPPQPPPGHRPVSPDEAQALLGRILGPDAEERADQMAYAAEVARAFAPRPSEHENVILLAEAGTGLGKTLGYLAPAVLWAQKNAGRVTLSTYTKNLQRQLVEETRRFWPDAAQHRRHVAVRKGRENYLCLLNAQESFASLSAATPKGATLAALVARWALASADGDMVGGDFPAWLMGLLAEESPRGTPPSPMALGLTDRRGECAHAACPHFRKCFIEKARVRAIKADLIVANHAIVMVQAAMDVMLGESAGREALADDALARIVFDEGHHLFEAADSAFSGHLTALETAELRRWIRGPEESRRRGRSLRDRLSDLISEGGRAFAEAVKAVEQAARCLPAPGWRRRLAERAPQGAAEVFLSLVRDHVRAHSRDHAGSTEMEADCHPAEPELIEAAETLEGALGLLERAMRHLAALLLKRLQEEAATLSTPERNRLEAMARSLNRRGGLIVGGWRGMLRRFAAGDDEEADPRFAEWFSLSFAYGQEMDVGLHAHWVDPTVPLAETVLAPADSVVITSATLRDRPPRQPDDWKSAEMRTGVTHLPWPVRRVSYPSPFDYAAQARVFVVTDVNRENMDAVASAYRALFLAAGGGALGLFTAISRLKAVYGRILEAMAEAGLPLLAQHVDAMDNGTLVDIFRHQEDACLLGTDAMRDGVDVPGRSLRLLVMDRVPWPRPTILERRRRAAFGEGRWTDMMVRLKLRQAFGRLIRKKEDRGVFVMLDPRLASRFHTAFPEGVPIIRCGLAEAVRATRTFLRA